MSHYRAIWLSDLHLGAHGCNAEKILTFLQANTADTIYLVGDIIDGWAIRRRVYWPTAHSDIVQDILAKAKNSKIIYIVGNHDEFLVDFIGENIGGIVICRESVHTTTDGKKLLIIHGDKFDYIAMNYNWVALLGDRVYTLMLRVNNIVSWFRRKSGKPHFSLSAYLKNQTKTFTSFISDYESALALECSTRGFDGIICGHIHHADITEIKGIKYFNTGDGVESCTALVEEFEGTIKLICYYDKINQIVKQLDKPQSSVVYMAHSN
jgi:UDP-2,3-diacylglucosamine pyrophosphatase LpxH